MWRFACLDRLASLGPYGFDVALGESQALDLRPLDLQGRHGRPHRRPAARGQLRRRLLCPATLAVCADRVPLPLAGRGLGVGVKPRTFLRLPPPPTPPRKGEGSRAALVATVCAMRDALGERPSRRRRAPRRRGDERQRAGAVRGEGQRHAQPRLARTCAASASRRRTRPTSARCSATASRPTGPAAPRRAIPTHAGAGAAAQAHDALRADRPLGRRPDVSRPSGGRPRPPCASATASRRACTCCRCG